MSEASSSAPSVGAIPWPALRWLRLVRKELRETLRDRRTLYTLLIMPLLVYPLLGGVFKKFLFSNMAAEKPLQIRVAVQDEAESRFFNNLLKEGAAWMHIAQAKVLAADKNDSGRNKGRQSSDETDSANTEVAFLANLDEPHIGPAEQVKRGFVDIALVRQKVELSQGRLWERILVFYNPKSPSSVKARALVETRLAAAKVPSLTQKLLANPGLIGALPAELLGIEIRGDNASGNVVQTLLPLVLILTTVTGAVYPAIDLTAGERERGTLETLMATPLPRLQILSAKYVAVTTVAMLTAAMNLFAMTLTIWGVNLQDLLFGGVSPSPWLLPQAFAILTVFAAFFSAMLLSVTSFARSFKEAQAYVIPLFLIALSPGVMALAPNVSLTPTLAAAPVMNLMLLARDLLSGGAPFLETAIVLISTLLYAYLAMAVAARTFGAESAASLHEIDLGVRRRAWADHPSFAVGCGIFAALMPLFLLTASLPGKFAGANLVESLLASAVVQVSLFGGLTLAGLIIAKARPRSSLALRLGAPLGYPVALVLAVCLWPLAYELTLAAGDSSIPSLADKFAEYVEKLKQTPLLLRLFCLALTPALMEECFFRGFLFAAVGTRCSPRNTILLTAVLFGLLHVLTQLLTPDSVLLLRLLPSTFLGLVLGYVRWRTGSLFPGVVLHAGHNGLLLSKDHFPKLLTWMGLNLEGAAHIPLIWVATSAGICLVALGMLTWFTSPREFVAQGELPHIPAIDGVGGVN